MWGGQGCAGTMRIHRRLAERLVMTRRCRVAQTLPTSLPQPSIVEGTTRMSCSRQTRATPVPDRTSRTSRETTPTGGGPIHRRRRRWEGATRTITDGSGTSHLLGRLRVAAGEGRTTREQWPTARRRQQRQQGLRLVGHEAAATPTTWVAAAVQVPAARRRCPRWWLRFRLPCCLEHEPLQRRVRFLRQAPLEEAHSRGPPPPPAAWGRSGTASFSSAESSQSRLPSSSIAPLPSFHHPSPIPFLLPLLPTPPQSPPTSSTADTAASPSYHRHRPCRHIHWGGQTSRGRTDPPTAGLDPSRDTLHTHRTPRWPEAPPWEGLAR